MKQRILEKIKKLRYSTLFILIFYSSIISLFCFSLYFLKDSDSKKGEKNSHQAIPYQEENEDIVSLKKFIAEGKKEGYFPSSVFFYNSIIDVIKLIDVNIDFNPVVQWTENAQCLLHRDQTILATDSEGHYVEHGGDDMVVLLGSGNDWVDLTSSNDIVLPGKGDDTIEVGSGSDIIIFEKNWGHDTVKMNSTQIDREKIIGNKNGYPWKFSSFIIFGKGVKREDIVWKGNTLLNTATGDTIALNTKDVNILFASSPVSLRNFPGYVPELQKPERINLDNLNVGNVVVQENIVYYANQFLGLYIVDMAEPDRPLLLSKTVLQGRANSVKIHNNIAYVAQQDEYAVGKKGWVTLIDIEDIQNPKIIKNIPFGNAVYEIAVTDNYLYIPEVNLPEKSKLHIFDNVNPRNPQHISVTSLPNYAKYIVYSDDTLYLSRKWSGIQVYDVKDPQKPVMTAEYGLGKFTVRSIKMHDNKVVVNQNENHLYVLVPTPDKKLYRYCEVETLHNKKMGPVGIDSIWIRDNIVYRGQGEEGVVLVDISTADQCKIIGSIRLRNQWGNSLYIVDNTLIFHSINGSATYNLDKKFPQYKKKKPLEKKYDTIEEKTEQTDAQKVPLSQALLQKRLYDAASHDDAGRVAELCTLGAKPNMQGNLHHKPIDISAMLGKLHSLRALLRCPGAVPTEDGMILSALQARFGSMKILEEYGGNIGQKDDDGCTTLHYLSASGTLDMVKYLVERGVPIGAQCRGGKTAIGWAESAGNRRIAEYLRSQQEH